MTDQIDPFDYSRSVAREHANRAAAYCYMLADVADMRDDESAIHVLSRIVFEVRQASAAVKLLQAKHLASSKHTEAA